MQADSKRISDGYEQKKEQIMGAASELFAHYGYAKTTLDDIANKIGIKKNSLYYYFKSKEDLFNEIVTEIYESKVAEYNQKAAKAKNNLEKLHIFLKILISPKFRNNKEINITPNAFIEIGRIIEESYREFFARTEDEAISILEEGIAKGEFRKHNTKEVARVLLDFTEALEFFEYSRSNLLHISQVDQNKMEQRLIKFVDLIYNGIKK